MVLPYKKRLKVREQWECRGETLHRPPAEPPAPQSAQAPAGTKRYAEKSLWNSSRQRRTEFADLHAKYNPDLSGPAFLRLIRRLTDAVRPLADKRLSDVRSDIQLFCIRVPGHEGDVHILRRDADGELRDLRLLKYADDDRALGQVIAQMEKSAFQSRGRSAAAQGTSVSHPHLSDLWENGQRQREFQSLYSAYRKLQGKLDTTGASFLSELHQLAVNAKQRGDAKRTTKEDILLFHIQVPGTPGPVHVLCRLDTSDKLSDIRLLASPDMLEEALEQMVDSQATGNGRRRGSSAPRRDRRLSMMWRQHLESRLAGALEDFLRMQPNRAPAGIEAFVRHLNELCDTCPAQTVDSRFGITRHVITPLGSTQPITLLRRKDKGELPRMRVLDGSRTAEDEALRSLRAVGPKRRPEGPVGARPGKRHQLHAPRSGQSGRITITEKTPTDNARAAAANQRTTRGRVQTGTAGRPLHKVVVPREHKGKTVRITHLVTGSVGHVRGEPRTLEWAYANSPELVRPPRSYQGDRERQVLRWLCTALAKAYPGGREVQAYYDRDRDEIWVSSNARGTNRKIARLLRSPDLPRALQEKIEALGQAADKADLDDRWTRHPSRLFHMLDDSASWPPEAKAVLQAMAGRRFRVPLENIDIDGVTRQIDLHAERRLQRALDAAGGTAIDPARVVGTKRACGTCAEDLQFPDTQPRGPFWQTRAASLFVDMPSVIRSHLENRIPTYVSQNRDGDFNLYVSDSESDA